MDGEPCGAEAGAEAGEAAGVYVRLGASGIEGFYSSFEGACGGAAPERVRWLPWEQDVALWGDGPRGHEVGCDGLGGGPGPSCRIPHEAVFCACAQAGGDPLDPSDAPCCAVFRSQDRGLAWAYVRHEHGLRRARALSAYAGAPPGPPAFGVVAWVPVLHEDPPQPPLQRLALVNIYRHGSGDLDLGLECMMSAELERLHADDTLPALYELVEADLSCLGDPATHDAAAREAARRRLLAPPGGGQPFPDDEQRARAVAAE
jgi:hypothetical protein